MSDTQTPSHHLTPFDGPIHPHWAATASRKGFEITRRVDDRYHLLLRCAECGHEHRSRLFVLMKSLPLCPHCIEARWRATARLAGLAWIGRDPESRHHGFYLAECGHVLRRQFELVGRIADGTCKHRCEACHATREHAEATAQGWQLLGPDPEGRINYRRYRHGCGHEQAVARVNMQTGRFNCASCGIGWSSAPSFLYCMRFTPPEGPPLVKLGFSRNPDSRLNHQLKRHPDIDGELLRVVPMPSGHAALRVEKRLHATLRAEFPDSGLARKRYRRWLRVKSEIYRADMEPVILERLDRVAADPGPSG